ncbi:MAG: LamG-like jellyroll fold domain-containing protein [Planctomycetota bacterium]
MDEKTTDTITPSDLLLVERFYLGDLSKDELVQLEAALESNRELRDQFRTAAINDACLRFRCGDSDEISHPDKILASNQLSRQKPSWLLYASMMAIAACILFGVGLLVRRNSDVANEIARDDTLEPPGQPSTDGTKSAFSARFMLHNDLLIEGLEDVGERLSKGTYEISRGEGTLRLDNGVELTMQAPAKFRLIDTMRVEWLSGRARAFVPPEGNGFRIITPQGEIEDLGTEFGVIVSDDQTSEVHVFAGEVRLHHTDQPTESLLEDEAMQLAGSKRHELPSSSDESFLTKSQIGFNRWKKSSHELRDDPDAICYYDFENRNPTSDILFDQSQTTPVNGRVVGCISASGRWPQKSAILFENAGDRIELSIPGEFDQVTFVAWVWINRFDFPIQSLFNTIDWDQGEHHFNLYRGGELRVGVQDDYVATISEERIPTGQWTQVGFVIDSDSATYFINGAKVSSVTRNASTEIVFDDCSIGAFGNTKQNATGIDEIRFNREIRGRVDEFALFSRAFSEQEFQSLYSSGNQTLN